ncbi:MAG: hypothetical protein ABSD10_03575 [Candidatus Saccharimonadales bacterium]|jgi:hypothetical protein
MFTSLGFGVIPEFSQRCCPPAERTIVHFDLFDDEHFGCSMNLGVCPHKRRRRRPPSKIRFAVGYVLIPFYDYLVALRKDLATIRNNSIARRQHKLAAGFSF